jgi:hypothetical protein
LERQPSIAMLDSQLQQLASDITEAAGGEEKGRSPEDQIRQIFQALVAERDNLKLEARLLKDRDAAITGALRFIVEYNNEPRMMSTLARLHAIVAHAQKTLVNQVELSSHWRAEVEAPWRRLLYSEHGCEAKTNESGEMRCPKCFIDFSRDSADRIGAKLMAVALTPEEKQR